MIQVRLIILLSLTIFVTAMPNDFEELGLKVNDRAARTVCGWVGTPPFCKNSWNGDKCAEALRVPKHPDWYVKKTSKKADGKKCLTGKRAMCCRDY